MRVSRQALGRRAPLLSASQIEKVRELREKGLSFGAIGRELGISETRVGNVCNKKGAYR